MDDPHTPSAALVLIGRAVPFVFGLIGLAGLLIAWLGSDRAVSRLWNSRQG